MDKMVNEVSTLVSTSRSPRNTKRDDPKPCISRSQFINNPSTSIACYRDHRYSGPRKSRKRVRALLKRHHGENVTRVDVWRKKTKQPSGSQSSNTTRPVIPVLRTYARKPKAHKEAIIIPKQETTAEIVEELDIECPILEPTRHTLDLDLNIDYPLLEPVKYSKLMAHKEAYIISKPEITSEIVVDLDVKCPILEPTRDPLDLDLNVDNPLLEPVKYSELMAHKEAYIISKPETTTEIVVDLDVKCPILEPTQDPLDLDLNVDNPLLEPVKYSLVYVNL